MEFNQVGKNFNINNNSVLKKKAEKPSVENIKKEETEKENSPVNPKYWQSQKGISFTGGTQKASDIEEVKNIFQAHAYNFWGEHAQEQYKLLTNDWLEAIPETTPKQAKCAATVILPRFIGNDKEFDDKRREFLKEFLNDKRYTLDEKIDYIITCSYGKLYKDDIFDEFASKAPDEMSAFSRYRRTFEDDEGKFTSKCYSEYKFGADTFNKMSDLAESGKITGKTLKQYIQGLPGWLDAEDTEALTELVDWLYEMKDDESKADMFSFCESLISSKLMPHSIKPANLLNLLRDESLFKSDLIKYLMQESKGECSYVFYSDSEMLLALSFITEENFEDFKAYTNADENKGSSVFDNLINARNYINPKTKHFDIDLYNLRRRFQMKAESSQSYMSDYYVNDIIKAAVDMKTGKVSDMALDFLDSYYFEDKEESKMSKIKNFVKNLNPVNGHKRNSRLAFYRNTFSSLDEYLPDILNAMKDKSGAFNETNRKYISQVMELPLRDTMPDFDFLNSMKDENGVIQKKKYDFGMKILYTINDTRRTKEILNIYNERGKEKADLIYEAAENIFKNEALVLMNFAPFTRNCFDEDGNAVEENLNFVMDLAEYIPDLILEDKVFNIVKNDDNKELIMKKAKKQQLSRYDLSAFAGMIERYGDENGNLSSFVKEKLEYALDHGVDLAMFGGFLDHCTQYGTQECDVKLLDSAVDLYGACNDIYWELGGSSAFFSFASGDFNIGEMAFKQKVVMLEALKKMKANLGAEINDKFPSIDKIISEIDESLSCDNISLPIDDEAKSRFASTVIKTTPSQTGGLTEFEDVMKNSTPLLKEMKDGLKITYPRGKFLADLSDLCGSKEKLKLLSDKTSINLITDDDGNITGYNGVMLLDKLNKEDYFEKKIYEICHKFFYENEVKTGNKALDEQMNTIIKACPEFLNTVGKPQHGTHQYSLDIHQLLVLANSINNPDYLKLNNSDKAMLKIACLFHDIAKQESIVDRGHQNPSSIYTRSIIKKFFNNPEARDRVYELVKNHHWLEELANDSSDEKAKELAFRFRRPNDFDIAKIMAKSDLMAVSDSFYETYKHALDTDKLKPVEDNLKYIYSTGCAVFSDYPIAPSKLDNHKEIYNGNEYKVINFHNIKESDDLGEYGFMPGLTKEDAKLLVHMVSSGSISSSLEILKKIASSVNGGVLSESVITPKYKRTYCDREYGVLLSQINPNIINANKTNQGSGNKKGIDEVIRLLYSESNDARKDFKNNLLKELRINPDEISDEEYAEFYKNHIAPKTSLSQFPDTKEYNLGKFKVKGSDIKDAVAKFQDGLIDKKEITHNEIVGYAPKIQGVVAKAKALSEVPLELLEFARENNLPVVLI